jgi:hypothetical protein
MNRRGKTALLVALVILEGVRQAAGQGLQIGIIDFYGLGRISEREARRALTFTEGDTIPIGDDAPSAVLAESKRRLSTLPGVVGAHANIVCCDAGRGIVYIGVEQRGRATTQFRAAPRGDVRLAADVVQAGRELGDAVDAAVRRGDSAEDDSQGHALFHDPAARAIQERFVSYAARDLNDLRRVLGDSSDTEQRALAAEILGYVANKQDVVDDLVYAMNDPAADVRNNAMRALGVFARLTPTSARPIVRIPYGPFVRLLNSPVWTDRNKASLALMGLSERRDPRLLRQLQREAMPALIDMARWKNEGHATPAVMILGRIAGQSEDAINGARTRSEREAIISAARKRR